MFKFGIFGLLYLREVELLIGFVWETWNEKPPLPLPCKSVPAFPQQSPQLFSPKIQSENKLLKSIQFPTRSLCHCATLLESTRTPDDHDIQNSIHAFQ